MEKNFFTSGSIQGVGIGLRAAHYPYILKHWPAVPWLEILTENYLAAGGMVLRRLQQIRERYPIVCHGVGMSLGSTDALNFDYFKKIKKLIERFQPAYVSDHLCWTSFAGQYLHELLPLPYTEEAIKHVAERIRLVQDFLERPILIENVSSYLTFKESQLTEWEFLNAVVAHAHCGILLDINNIYVSAHNHGFSPQDYLLGIKKNYVKQFHLAGYETYPGYFLDSHGTPVLPAVWELYQFALTQFGAVPTVIEWDNHIPEFPLVWAEAKKAQRIMESSRCAVQAE